MFNLKNKIGLNTQIGGIDYTTRFEDIVGDGTRLGEACSIDTSIKIAKNCRYIKQSVGCIQNTYWHEVLHMMLSDIGRHELCQEEELIEALSGKICEVLNTTDFVEISSIEELKQ